MKYYLSNAPATMTLADMAWVGCLRWTIEEDFELAKGEVVSRVKKSRHFGRPINPVRG
jgi:SRSO17 transposase